MPQDPMMQEAPMGPEAGMQEAPMGGDQDPLLMLAQMAAEGLQTQNCEMMGQVCEGLLMLIQEAQAGMQQQAPQGEPVFKRGGKIIARR